MPGHKTSPAPAGHRAPQTGGHHDPRRFSQSRRSPRPRMGPYATQVTAHTSARQHTAPTTSIAVKAVDGYSGKTCRFEIQMVESLPWGLTLAVMRQNDHCVLGGGTTRGKSRPPTKRRTRQSTTMNSVHIEKLCPPNSGTMSGTLMVVEVSITSAHSIASAVRLVVAAACLPPAFAAAATAPVASLAALAFVGLLLVFSLSRSRVRHPYSAMTLEATPESTQGTALSSLRKNRIIRGARWAALTTRVISMFPSRSPRSGTKGEAVGALGALDPF
mmetsp:Transcript_14568/g.38490  ORF Transcript_14568/g.38490 Transcript_14568/m.38490 type:complete len:274 (+) Transcript_14568:73-894(+)